MMEELPQHCNYLSLGAARIREIRSIITKLKNCDHGGRAFQNLPRHMQRRAVSSNPKRLPKYLRERHKREGGANVKPSHRPRRKYRRRPCNLLTEYNRRQKEFIWLETHIWHAKRFHMKRQWGYALPDTPTFKGYRATLRAATKSCLIQDVSYLCCIELEGPKKSLIAGLSRMMDPTSLATLTDSQLQFGQKWTSLTLFQPGRQPYGAVADADILWHPPSSFISEAKSEISKIWIWVHPSAHNQVIESLVEIFQLVKMPNRFEIISGQEHAEKISGIDRTGQEDAEKISGIDRAGQEVAEKISGIDRAGQEVAEKISGIARAGQEDAEKVSSSDRQKYNVNNGEEVKLQQGLCGTEVNMECMETKNMQSKVMQTSIGITCEELSNENSEIEKDDVDKHQHRTSKHENVKNVNALKLLKKNIPFERTPKYTSSSNSITMTLLKDTLNRIKLTGPKSYSVLMASLIPAKVTTTTEENISSSCDESQHLSQPWWKQYYHSKERELCHQQQVDTWKKIAASPLPRVILPLTVRDPRVTLPHKKLPILGVTPDMTEKIMHPAWPVDSPLYDNDLRDMITQSKEPDAVINNRRSQLLVPGSKLPESEEEARLPVLLLSRPPTCSAGLGCGWDVVVAAGWGMSLWMSLVFCGGVAGGQQESENLHLEALTPLPPHLLPDTPAGSYYSTLLAEKRHTQFFKRPPAKRHNYIKLGVQYPFCPPWRKLLQEWEPGTQDIFVLRDVRFLNGLSHLLGNTVKSVKKDAQKRKANDLDEAFSKKLRTGRSEENNHDFETYLEKENEGKGLSNGEDSSVESHADILQAQDLYKFSIEELQKMNHGCLVMVKLALQYKGTLEPCAMICLPEEEDLEAKEKITKPSESKEGPMEPAHTDPQSTKRVQLKEEHAKIKIYKMLGPKYLTTAAILKQLFAKLPNRALCPNGQLFSQHLEHLTFSGKKGGYINGRIRRLRRKARLRVAMETDIVSTAQSGQNIEKATADALEKVNEENKVILSKYSSFKEEMEGAWLMKTDGPLQCCSRKIIGYIAHGNFCQTLGKGAGIGWVALRSLNFLQLCRKVYDEQTESNNESQEFLESRRESKGEYFVLVRNPTNLHYRWAKLSIILQPQ